MRLTARPSLARTVVGVVAASALAFSLTACYSTSDSESNNTAPIHRENPELPESEATPLAVVADLSQGVDTQVAVDEGFVGALELLGLTPGVVGDATFEDGTFSFPITGGNVSYYDPESEVRPYVQGDIQHDDSGLSLTAGDTVVELTNFDIDPGASKLYGDVAVNGEPVAGHAYLFNLWGGTLEPLRIEGADAILEGTTVHVSPEAAELLNTTFETDLVPDELLVGVATITVATR